VSFCHIDIFTTLFAISVYMQSLCLPDKPGNVRELDSYQAHVGEIDQMPGKYLVRENCLLVSLHFGLF